MPRTMTISRSSRCCLPPGDEEIVRLTGLLAQRIRAFLQKRGLGADSNPEESDPLAREQPWLAGVYAASVRGRLGKFGTYGTRRGDQIDPESMEAPSNPRCASVDGFSVHGNVAVSAGDRARLERLAQYCARGPVATERLEMLTDGRLLYRFKRAWRDGTTHIILMPLDMLEKLSALIPAPHVHLVRYADLLAPAAKWRSVIVPTAASMEADSTIHCCDVETTAYFKESAASEAVASAAESSVAPHGRNYAWAELMKRV